MESQNFKETREKLTVALYNVDFLLSGTFVLTSGFTINAYLDLIAVFSRPSVLNSICDLAHDVLLMKKIPVQNVCGVTYAGIPFATLIAQKFQAPILIRNKETSLSANDKRIVGNIHHGNEVLIVEEVLCSAASALQTIKDVEDTGMIVKHVLAIIYTEQGGEENLSKLGYNLHSVFKLSELSAILLNLGVLDDKKMEDIRITWNRTYTPNGDVITNTILEKRKPQSYESRASMMKAKISQKLFKLIVTKKSNLCVTLDCDNFDRIIKTASQIGPHICILNLRLDSLDIQDLSRMEELHKIAKKFDFLLMDDRKISETGDELRSLVKRTLRFVDMVSILPLEGESTLSVLDELLTVMPNKGLIVVGSCLTQDALIKSSFERSAVKTTLEKCAFVTGFVTHHNSEIPLPYVHFMQDFKTTSRITKFNSSHPYYGENIITQEIAADVVIININCEEGFLNYVQQKQLSSWLGYEKRLEKAS